MLEEVDRIATPGADVDVPEEARSPQLQEVMDRFGLGPFRHLIRSPPQQPETRSWVQSQLAVARPERVMADPNEVAIEEEPIEMGSRVGDPRGEHVALEHGCRNHRAGESSDRIGEGSRGRRRVVPDSLPGNVERGKGGGWHRLYLPAQNGQGAAFQPSQHLAVDPFPSLPARTEGADIDPPRRLQLPEDGLDDAGRDGQGIGRLSGGEWAVGSGIPANDIAEWIVYRLEEHMGDAGRWLDPEGITQPRNVLDRGPSGDPTVDDLDDPSLAGELTEHRRDVQPVGAHLEILDGHRSEVPQHVVDPVGSLDSPALGQVLQFELNGGHDLGVDQLAKLPLTEQFPEQVPIEGHGRRPTFGQRGVGLVEERCDEREEQRRGKRAR